MALYPDYSTYKLLVHHVLPAVSFDQFDIVCAPHYVPYPENAFGHIEICAPTAVERNSNSEFYVRNGILFATRLKEKNSAKSSVLYVAIINVYQEEKKTIIYLYEYQTTFCQNENHCILFHCESTTL